MRRIVSFLLASIAASLSGTPVVFAQWHGWDSQASQELMVTKVTSVAGVLPVPSGPIVSFCHFPANAVPCINKATAYSSNALETSCPTSTQIVLPGATSCVANPDSQGNWGVWVPSRQYSYTPTLGREKFGPYVVNFGVPTGTNPSLGTVTTANSDSCRIGNDRYIDQANLCGWSGTNFVGWVNSAYSDCPPAGCEIHISPGSYTSSSTTGILITTKGKPARLVCPPAGATTLNFTASNATAVTFNFSAGNLAGAGVDGCQFVGPGSGSSSVAFSIGGANGASQLAFRDIKVSGFGTFESYGNNAFSIDHSNVVAIGNGVGVSILNGVTNTGESIHFSHSSLGGVSGTAEQCLDVRSSVNNLSFVGGSFDQCTWNITAGQIHISNTHFENPQARMSTPLFVNNGARVVLDSSDFQWDFNGAPSPSAAISCTAGVLIPIGTSFLSATATLANDISDTGTCELHEFGTKLSSGFTGFIGYSSRGAVSSYGNVWGNNVVNGSLNATILNLAEGACSDGVSGNSVLCSDSTAHVLKASYNNGPFLALSQVIPVSFTTTAMTSEVVTVTGMTSSGHCTVTPTSSAAAGGIASVFLDTYTTNAVTIHHTATSGWTFNLLCTPN
jgi:hypothetical protein